MHQEMLRHRRVLEKKGACILKVLRVIDKLRPDETSLMSCRLWWWLCRVQIVFPRCFDWSVRTSTIFAVRRVSGSRPRSPSSGPGVVFGWVWLLAQGSSLQGEAACWKSRDQRLKKWNWNPKWHGLKVKAIFTFNYLPFLIGWRNLGYDVALI